MSKGTPFYTRGILPANKTRYTLELSIWGTISALTLAMKTVCSSLDRRHQSSHQEPQFECPVCQRRFHRKDLLERHYKRWVEKSSETRNVADDNLHKTWRRNRGSFGPSIHGVMMWCWRSLGGLSIMNSVVVTKVHARMGQRWINRGNIMRDDSG